MAALTRSALLVSVTELLQRPGTRREVSRIVTSPGYEVTGSSVPAGVDVAVDVVVESTADPGTLTVTGTVAAPWRGECRRCLAEVEGVLEVDVHEVFSRSPSSTGGDDDVWPLEGQEIDLAEVVADALLLALPLAPLCGPDCQGPAPDEYPARVVEDADAGDDDASGAGPGRDPRWAALDELRFD